MTRTLHRALFKSILRHPFIATLPWPMLVYDLLITRWKQRYREGIFGAGASKQRQQKTDRPAAAL